MTFAQMAIATNADRTWLNNARRLLGRRMHRTPSGARWWGLVRMLSHEVGLPLKSAAVVADTVLSAASSLTRVRLTATRDGSVTLRIDLERFHSTATARLASAFAFAQPGRRGRPAPALRRKRAVDEFPAAWEMRVEDDREKLERLARQLRDWDAYPRGVERGLPFLLDAAILRAVPRLALVTSKGDVDVIVSGKAALRERSQGIPG